MAEHQSSKVALYQRPVWSYPRPLAIPYFLPIGFTLYSTQKYLSVLEKRTERLWQKQCQ